MKLISGKIVAGQVVVEGDTFDEGAVVSVFSSELDETFELSAEEESALMLSIEEAERGAVVAAADLMQSLRRQY